MRSWPVASGRANGPVTWASNDTACQARSGARMHGGRRRGYRQVGGRVLADRPCHRRRHAAGQRSSADVCGDRISWTVQPAHRASPRPGRATRLCRRAGHAPVRWRAAWRAVRVASTGAVQRVAAGAVELAHVSAPRCPCVSVVQLAGTVHCDRRRPCRQSARRYPPAQPAARAAPPAPAGCSCRWRRMNWPASA